MAGQLSNEQVLLLNNLMYMTDSEPLINVVGAEGKTIGRLLSEIDVSTLKLDQDYGSLITGEEWKNIINTIQKDEQLLNMKIESTHIDNSPDGGGGVSAIFVDPSNNEAVITFRGTASHEWKDNFSGGGKTNGLDGVSTLHQENALEWYRSQNLDQYDTITVTGHSKGGNKAKYITVMDDSVDRCLAFDGQGFSDEFINKYQDKILLNQDKIFNHNVDSDYVNLLLNDIGKTTFYKGYNYGKGGFLENHCPNTFFDFNEDGTVKMTTSERDKRMEAVDEFLNNYLRTLSVEDKQDTLGMIGELVEGGFNQAKLDEILDICLKDDNVDHAGNLLAYLLKYKKENPELVESMNEVLNEMGMSEMTKLITALDNITNKWYFDLFMDGAGWVSEKIPSFVFEYLQEKGVNLTEEEMRKLLSIVQTVADDMDDIKIEDNGKDISVSSKTNSTISTKGKPCSFAVNVSRLKEMESKLEATYMQLVNYSEEVQDIYERLGCSFLDLKIKLKGIQTKMIQEIQGCKDMKQALSHIHYYYKNSEEKIIENTNIQ